MALHATTTHPADRAYMAIGRAGAAPRMEGSTQRIAAASKRMRSAPWLRSPPADARCSCAASVSLGAGETLAKCAGSSAPDDGRLGPPAVVRSVGATGAYAVPFVLVALGMCIVAESGPL